MFEIGQSAGVSRRFSESDIANYVSLGGQATIARTVPEPLVGALFSYLLGVDLPGIGTNYLKQETRFLCDANIDELLTAYVVITRLRPGMNLVNLKTICHGSENGLICEGRALVYTADVTSEDAPTQKAVLSA